MRQLDEKQYPPLFQDVLREVHPRELKRYLLREEWGSRRKLILRQLFLLLRQVCAVGLEGDLWIDGSFVTEKPVPGDVDLVFWADAVTGETQFELLEKLSKQELRQLNFCHTFAYLKPNVEGRNWMTHGLPSTCLAFLGKDRENQSKGVLSCRIDRNLEVDSLIEELA